MTAKRETHPRVHMASLGCAKNLVDSERLLARLASAGAWVGAAPEDADVIIVNTCGFIEPAKAESLDTIREYLDGRRKGQKLLVIGCLVERCSEELHRELPQVDGFFGLHEHRAIAAATGLGDTEQDDARLLLTPPHLAYVRISDGCDNCCSYCTIPQIRGPFASRPADEIVAEARQLVDGGVREVALIGQDTTSYGKDRADGTRIHDLLARLADIDNLRWIRLLYAHPAHVTEELISCYRHLASLVPYMDLPLQHTSDRILHSMGRRAGRREILSLIDRLRSAVPGLALRTTFIVGYPGETDREFRQLLMDVEQLKFDHLGAFAYSPEPGTRAADLDGRVPEDVVAARLDAVMLAQQDVVAARNREMLGQRLEVLIDEPTAEPDLWIARSATQAPDVDPVTLVEATDLVPGRFYDVTIVGADGYDLISIPDVSA